MRVSRSLVTTLCVVVLPLAASAHGYAGKRFFPATMAVDDPFVADEAGFLFSHNKDDSNSHVNDLSAEYAKTITPNFALSIGTDYMRVNPETGRTETGFGNTEIGAKYLLYKNADHESIISVGATAELGGTGDSAVGAESSSTISPTLYFGKGMGDLPDSLQYLRPLAITGTIGPSLNASNKFDTENIDTGFTISYDLGYLQHYVKDVGIGPDLSRVIPIIEVPLSTCTTGECSGQVTGTVNPGILWRGDNIQLGLEAMIPVNSASGSHTGVMAQLHFYMDDIYPHSLGRPIFR